MTTGGGAVSGEISVNIRTEGGSGIPGTGGGTPRPPGGGGGPKDPQLSMLTADQKKTLENAREQKKALKEYQDFQKLDTKKGQGELLNELQRGRRQATMVAGAVTTGMLARNSKIMSTSMGALNTMFSAFIDVFLMPFIPLIIPVLKYIASLLPKWMEWTQKFADLFKENPLKALKWAAEQFLKQIENIGIQIGALFGFSEDEVRAFYAKVREWAKSTWDFIQTAWNEGVTYIKGAWERAGGDLWEFIKIVGKEAWAELLQVGKNMWAEIQTQAKAAWTAFADRFPKTAAAIETAWVTSSNAVKGAWQAASDYIKGVWEASGCSIMGSIGAIGRDAMSQIGRAGVAGWNAFKGWQPGVAASIEGAWCSASTYVTNAWKAGGGTIVGFFGVVADDVGAKIKEGLRWLWDNIFRDKVLGMLDSIQTWIWQKTGIGSAPGGRVNPGSGIDPKTGVQVPLSQIGAEFGNLDLLKNQSPSSIRPPAWQEFFGRGDYDAGMMAKNLGRGAGKWKIPFGPQIDLFDKKGGQSRDIYEKFIEETSLPMHARALEQRGESVQDIQSFIQRRVRESYSERFSIVELYKKNGEWKVDVDINEHFTPHDKIDGMIIS